MTKDEFEEAVVAEVSKIAVERDRVAFLLSVISTLVVFTGEDAINYTANAHDLGPKKGKRS